MSRSGAYALDDLELWVYKAGDIIVEEGDPGKEMFIIQTGKVKITKTVMGKSSVLAYLGPGEFFGELSLINQRPRTATAEAYTDVTLRALDWDTLQKRTKKYSVLATKLIHTLATRLESTLDALSTLMGDRHVEKLCGELMLLAQYCNPGGAEELELPFYPAGLVRRTGLTESEVEDYLGALESHGLIRFRSGNIVIPSLEAMRDYIEQL